MDSLPRIGLGTMKIESPDAIETALDLGYRHLDTARLYGNEAVVGEGLAAADVPREEVSVATKVWVDSLSYDDVIETARGSREKLGVDTIDLLYVHRPRGDYEPAETLAAFDELVDRGWIDEVGVSNFELSDLETARDHLDAPIYANQIELHPLFYTPELLADAADHGYHVVAYSPLIGGRAGDQDALVEVAERHDATPEQVSLAWLIEKGAVPIPKASSRDHLASNLAAADLALDDEDVARIDTIGEEYEIYPE